MVWRAWTFLAGLPLGVLALWALPLRSGALALLAATALGGGLLALVTSLAARYGGDEPERGRHLALAATAGLAGLPALGAAWLGLAPGPAWSLALLLGVLAALLVRAARVQGRAGGARRGAAAAAAALAGGALFWLALAGALAALGPGTPAPTEARASYVYGVDAEVALRPLPRCDGVANVRTLLERGAHPRLGPEGRFVWLDAPGPAGRRQVHRLERRTGELTCWTCDEPGANRRPAPHPSGTALVFDSDRYATARHPANTEIHWIRAGEEPPRAASRRLTRSPDPDERALFDAGGRGIVWSRGHSGRFDVVAASLRSGHGGLVLGGASVLAGGETRWVAPLAWSPDARHLALASGQPYGPVSVRLLDPATGESSPLSGTHPPAGGVAFNADGAWMAVARARARGAASRLPGALGFLLGRVRAATDGTPLLRSTSLRTGPTAEPGAELELGAIAQWGAPTGLALLPDGSGIVLGQRRDAAPRERIVEIELDCAGAELRAAEEGERR